MDNQRRMQSRQGGSGVALALVLEVGVWGGMPVAPQRVAAAVSPATGGGCSTASFTQAVGPFGAGSGPWSGAVGDFNGDGKPDLAVANRFDNTVTIRLGDGTGAFPDATS